MPFAGAGKVWIDFQFVAIDADFAVDDRAAARMVGQAEGDFGFSSHRALPFES
jgi:hypothetical protein